jgi:hypothetical protein
MKAHSYVTLAMHTYNVLNMPNKRAHIVLPHDLIKDIDAEVGPRGRSAFLVEIAREGLRRRRLLRLLRSDDPEATGGETDDRQDSATWVRNLRKESDSRIPKSNRPKAR